MCLGKDMIHESICEVVSEVLVLTVKSQIESVGVANTLVPSNSAITASEIVLRGFGSLDSSVSSDGSAPCLPLPSHSLRARRIWFDSRKGKNDQSRTSILSGPGNTMSVICMVPQTYLDNVNTLNFLTAKYSLS